MESVDHPLVAVLAGDHLGHDPDKRLEREGLAQHGRRAESGRLSQRPFVPGAHDDQDCRVALVDATQHRTREVAVVVVKADEIGDDQIRSQVGGRIVQTLDERKLVALLAKHIANEVSDRAIVVDDQDLRYSRTLADSGRGRNFDGRGNTVEAT